MIGLMLHYTQHLPGHGRKVGTNRVPIPVARPSILETSSTLADQFEQRFAGGVGHTPTYCLLLRIQPGARQQIGEANHTVERRADFMTQYLARKRDLATFACSASVRASSAAARFVSGP